MKLTKSRLLEISEEIAEKNMSLDQIVDYIVRIVTERLLPGQTARFTVVRGRQRLVVPVKLAERAPAG